ncbi:MAG: CDGSH iron-sulfur domain-containing protein [Deltaproteobacteria bacterium]|nr:CDGSH iron-sulfur domain-containing protein [Deltaproteobacteria bacterium]
MREPSSERDDPKPYRAIACYCGASRRMPFCDGSHMVTGFPSAAEPPPQAPNPIEILNAPISEPEA